MEAKNTKKVYIYIILILILIIAGMCLWASQGRGTVAASTANDEIPGIAADTAATPEIEDKQTITAKQEQIGQKKSAEETPAEEEPVVREAGEGNAKGKSEAAEKNDDFTIAEGRFSCFDNTLFIGDSRTEGFMLYAGVDNASYFCGRGLTVDKIVDGKELTVKGETVSIYDVLAKKDYERIYISAGLNELGWYSMDTFRKRYGELIDLVKEKQPEAEIILQAVLPVTQWRSDNDKTNNNTQIYWYNVNIIELADEKEVGYVNAAASVADDTGVLDPDATSDGIHFNKKFCQKWADYLVAKLNGEV